MTAAEALYRDNLELSRAEFQLQQIHLRSRPRIIGATVARAAQLELGESPELTR